MRLQRSGDERPLRPGDVVEVRSAAAILATLDGSGALDGMPFMAEMVAHLGKRYRVSRRVEKICNTVDNSGCRRMYATVYLADLRCDGSGHGGCQAGCLLYWKEAWLRRVEVGATGVTRDDPDAAELLRIASARSRTTRDVEGKACDVWRCQATEALIASQRLKVSDVGQYWREVNSGNFGLLRFARLIARAFVMEIAGRIGLLRSLPLRGPAGPASAEILNLQPGEFVQVRAASEIAATLDQEGFNRGLSFDREMLPYCGRTFRVRAKVRQIIDDRTGRMLKLPKDCVILDGVVCSGERSVGRWFCPRQIYPYWRKSWLRRVEGPNVA